LVVVALSADVHEVELVDQPELFQPVQRAVNGRAVDGAVLRSGAAVDGFGVQVLFGRFEQIREQLALARQAQAPCLHALQEPVVFEGAALHFEPEAGWGFETATRRIRLPLTRTTSSVRPPKGMASATRASRPRRACTRP